MGLNHTQEIFGQPFLIDFIVAPPLLPGSILPVPEGRGAGDCNYLSRMLFSKGIFKRGKRQIGEAWLTFRVIAGSILGIMVITCMQPVILSLKAKFRWTALKAYIGRDGRSIEIVRES
ncbi:MAG: hypothetical protein BWY75_01784 [bacterium ADurb.Bin425]|nr:MAG: hypothetical protein BWY75_01784 [bacterium ADurb.Bin425]